MERFAIGQRVLLIIDEAQNLDAKNLEVLRPLSNIVAIGCLMLFTLEKGPAPQFLKAAFRPETSIKFQRRRHISRRATSSVRLTTNYG